MAIDIANAAKSLAAARETSNRSSRFLCLHLLREQQFVAARGCKYIFAADGIKSRDGPAAMKALAKGRHEPNCSNRVKRHSIMCLGCQSILALVTQIRPMLSVRRPSTWRWSGCPMPEQCFARAACRRLRANSREADHLPSGCQAILPWLTNNASLLLN